jgi:RND family efflux transporter MFP subunit
MNFLSFFKPSKIKLIALVTIIVFSFLIFNFYLKPKDVSYQYYQAKRMEISETVSSSGSLTGKEIANLRFKFSGKIEYINVKEGERVFPGQPIAGLDSKQFQIDLQQAVNTFVAKDAAAKRIEDDVKDHDKDETFTQKETRTAAQVARDNAFDEIKAAKETLSEAKLYTPIEGLVTKATFLVGQNVTAADLIAQIVNISEIYFDTDVDESDISKISIGQEAIVELDAYPNEEFQGNVEKIIPQTNTVSSGATVVTVRIKLTNFPVNFVNGLSGQSEIVLRSAKNTITVPIEALSSDDYVIIRSPEGSFEKRKVVVGIQSDFDSEIVEGLSEDEVVVLNPPANLLK